MNKNKILFLPVIYLILLIVFILIRAVTSRYLDVIDFYPYILIYLASLIVTCPLSFIYIHITKDKDIDNMKLKLFLLQTPSLLAFMFCTYGILMVRVVID